VLLYVACDRREKKRKRRRKKEEKKEEKKKKKSCIFCLFYDLFLLAAPAAGCMGGEP